MMAQCANLQQTVQGKCRQCGSAGQVVADFRERNGLCWSCAVREDLRDAMHAIEDEAHRIIDAGLAAISRPPGDSGSPAMRKEHARQLRQMHVVIRLYSLSATALMGTAWNPHELQVAFFHAWDELRAIGAEMWDGFRSLPSLLKSPPWDRCQISFSDSHNSCVYHMGTGFRQGMGSGSGGWSCNGPLRTEEEIRLGMCASCLMRHGRTLGLRAEERETVTE